MFKRAALVAVVCMLLISMLSIASYADDSCVIGVSPNISSIEMTKGGSEKLDLSDVFLDSGGHELTFTLDEASDELKARIDDQGNLRLDPLVTGSFQVKITAVCTQNQEVRQQLTLPVNVSESEDEGNPRQYGYDETPADSVTVYLTMSSDGIPLVGNDADNTVMSHLKVTVPYFDLGLYGLEQFYRFHTKDGKGEYVDDEVVERPTAMHMFIYITERYYLGIPEEDCCKGTSKIMSYTGSMDVKNINGKTAYYASGRAYELSGCATSTYMEHLWGHDPNLMYYRNHVFPLMSPGWGSTADYQLLSDGDTFDVGMHSDANFYSAGVFLCFDQEEYTAETGKPVGLISMYSSASSFSSNVLKPINNVTVSVYDSEWNKVGETTCVGASHSYTFNEPGTYHLVGYFNEHGAPSTADVEVTDSFEDYPFLSIKDEKGNLLSYIEEMDDIPYDQHFHVKVPDGTESVTIEWEELLPFDYKVTYWDYGKEELTETQEALQKEGNTVTLDPSGWLKNDRAILIVDSEHHTYGAFTFEPYVDEGYNFAPRLKDGVKEEIKKTVREQKNYTVKMSDLFVDPEGDAMTYTVRVDDGEEEPADAEYTFYTGEPGSHKLVFTPADSKGAAGQTHTQLLTIKKNELPELTDPSANSKEVSIRYDEQAKLLINRVHYTAGEWESTEGLFTDINNDDLMFYLSTNDGEYEAFEPLVENPWYNDLNGVHYDDYHYYLTYKPTGKDDIGNTYTFKLKTGDDLGFGDDIFTYTVHVVENQAPVPDEAELTDYCMLNHYWYLNPQSFFKDPEGDKMMSYSVSVNGSAPVYCDRVWHNGTFNNHRVLIDKNEPFTVQFFAEDKYGDVGTCTARIYPTEEVLHDANLNDNIFSAGSGVDTFKASYNVTLRSATYSEYDGDHNYYLDVDDYGVSDGDKVTLTKRNAENVLAGYGNSYNGSIQLNLTKGSTTAGSAQVSDGDRFMIDMIESGDPEPEELILEPQYSELYVGEYADRCVVKAKFRDNVTRYISNYSLSDEKYDAAGKHTLTVSALGLTASAGIDVKNVPENVAVINDLGKYGRLAFAEVVDQNNEPFRDASITVSDPVMDPAYDDSKYDGTGYGGIPDMLRKTYDVDVRVPMSYDSDQVRVRFRMYKEQDQASEYMMGDGKHGNTSIYLDGDLVENEEHLMLTDSYKIIELADGKGTGEAWWIDRDWGMRNWWHSYDLFQVSVRTGAYEIVGKVSSWDEKDNAEFLAYPADMTDAEIRADAMGERNKALATSASTGEAVKADGRYERTFTVEGLDAGKYKLAVVKPGKYVVTVNEAELDGTADLGTITLRLFGDINNDGRVRAGDATQVCRYIAGNRSLTDEEFLAADVNLDGKVRAGDATQIARYIAGNASAFDSLDR